MQNISDNTTQAFTVYGGQYQQSFNPEDHGTSPLSVVDAQRGSVAMTTTINTGFGSKIISNSTGQLAPPWLFTCASNILMNIAFVHAAALS